MTDNTIVEDSVLNEVDPNALESLFEMDPEEYNEQDLEGIVSAKRTKRTDWEAKEREKGKNAGMKRQRRDVPQDGVVMDDLDLDLGLKL